MRSHSQVVLVNFWRGQMQNVRGWRDFKNIIKLRDTILQWMRSSDFMPVKRFWDRSYM